MSNNEEDKNRSETPPPSYNEALAISTANCQTNANANPGTNANSDANGLSENEDLFVTLPQYQSLHPLPPPMPESPQESRLPDGATSLITTNSCQHLQTNSLMAPIVQCSISVANESRTAV